MNAHYTTAINAAIHAGNAIMKIYVQDFEVFTKEDASPLTMADKNAHEIIVAELRSTNIPVLSEESSDLSYDSRKDWKTYWLVDPLDGTKEFVKRNGEFTVNIALVENGSPVFGVIYAPVLKDLYVGDVHKNESFKVAVSEDFDANNLIENKTLLKAKRNTTDIFRVVASRSHKNKATEMFLSELRLQNFKNVELVSIGSSLKFCMMAEGKADLYPRMAPTMEWDTAAGQAICIAAGLEVLQMEEKKPLEYNKENLMNPYFIVQ